MVEQTALWPVKPNWASEYSEAFEFFTEIFETEDRSEQRRALRAVPRQTIRFSGVAKSRTSAVFDRLNTRNTQVWQIASIRDPGVLAAQIGTTSSAVSFTSPPIWATAGAFAAVFSDFGRAELLEFAGPNALTEPSRNVWPTGTVVYQCVPANLNSAGANFRTSAVAELDVEFLLDPSYEIFAPALTYPTHKSRPVFPLRPNWSSAVQTDFSAVVLEADFGHGPVVRSPRGSFGLKTIQASYGLLTRLEQAQMLRFFLDCRGAQKSFYLPAPFEEFPVGSVSGNTLVVPGTEFADLYAADGSHRNVAVTLATGATLYYEAASIMPDADTSRIALAGALPPGPVMSVAWLLPTRFETDTLELAWVSSAYASTGLTFRSLED